MSQAEVMSRRDALAGEAAGLVGAAGLHLDECGGHPAGGLRLLCLLRLRVGSAVPSARGEFRLETGHVLLRFGLERRVVLAR